jgi:potassium efflux system protein
LYPGAWAADAGETPGSPGDLPRPLPARITPLTIQQAELELKTTRLRLESLRLELASAQKREAEAEKQLGWMRDSLQAATTEAQRKVLQAAIDKQTQRLRKAQQHRQETETALARTEPRIQALKGWLERLREGFRQQQEAALVADLKRLEEKSSEEIARQNKRIQRLTQKLQQTDAADEDQRALLAARIDAAQNRIFITQTRLKLAGAGSAFRHLNTLDRELGPADIEAIQLDLDKIRKLLQDLGPDSELLQRKLDLLQSQQRVLRQKIEAHQLSARAGGEISALLKRDERTLKAQLDEARQLYQRLQTQHKHLESAYARLLNADLSARQKLPTADGSGARLLKELFNLPQRLQQLISLRIQHLPIQFRQLPMERLWGALLWLLLTLGAGFIYHYRMRGTRRRALAAQTFSARISAIALHVLRGISIPASLALGVGGTLWLARADILLTQLSTLLFGTWVLIRLLRDLAYWFLVSPLVPEDRRETRLHRALSINIWFSGVLGLLMGLGWLGVSSDAFSIVANRLFMLSLLPAVYLAFRLRRLVIERLQARETRSYWLWVLRLVSLAVPLAALGIAIPGLTGYINLARLVAWYLIATLLIITAWLVLRGLLGDLSTALARYVERDARRGRLWYEGLIRPLHLGARVLLALATLLALMRLYGVGRQSTLPALLRGVLGHPLITIGHTQIDLAHLLLFLLVAIGAFPAGGWMRRLSFSWLYAGVSDRGIRNSLAVFTQYVTVLFGLLIAINLLGIDLTSLAVFAGALGVGVGFGLQNIANNFISGLILLAERPIRVGDWVTVTGHEGEITAIGIRSATLTTWDNQDVVIPNAELISNAFTNWTLSNPLVRTVLHVGVSYACDPHQAQQVIEEAVSMQPEVLLDPAPRVQLNDFGDSSVDLRVLYYIDVTQSSRMGVKSKVMFAIWDALKEAQIEIPFPQRDIHIRELPPGTRGDPAQPGPMPA